MRVVGLFAGIGGFEAGFSRAGHEIVGLCEWDEDAMSVLQRHFPDAEKFADVTAIERLPPNTDLVLAGFPCQDLSQAGRMAGITGSRSGLVNRVFDLVSDRWVPWVVLENVQNLLRLHGGAGMAHVTSRLEEIGYNWAYRTVDTRAFGLPQRRLRVFLVASLHGDPSGVLFSDSMTPSWPDDRVFDPDTEAYGFYWTEGNTGVGWARDAVPTLKGGSAVAIPSAPAVWRVKAADQDAFMTPGLEDAEALQGFRRGWSALDGTGTRERRRWRMVGNAVTVPIAEWIGRRVHSPGEPLEADLRPRGDKWPSAARGGPGKVCEAVGVSTWPVCESQQHLHEVVIGGVPLSGRAAVGFYDRLMRSSLRGGPPTFRRALAAYCSARGFARVWSEGE